MPKTSESKGTKLSLSSKTFEQLIGASGLMLEACSIDDGVISATVRSGRRTRRCPHCGRRSGSVHSVYRRTLTGLPVSARGMTITFTARRFRCMNAACRHKTFAEQVENLTERYSRITVGVRHLMERGLPEMSAVKYSRLSGLYGIRRSPSTCLRMTYRMALPEQDRASVRRVRIDDFALRKGAEYGTTLMDADTGRVIAMTEGRSKEKAESLLEQYPNIAVVSRDRSGAYAAAVSAALPDAVQVADRFHLVKNCGESMEGQLKESSALLTEEVAGAISVDTASGSTLAVLEKRAEVMSKAYYQAISGYHAGGMSVDMIVRKYRYSRAAVKECIRECSRTDEDVKRGLAAGIVADRRLKLYLANPSYGVRKDTGECSQEHLMMNKVIAGSATLSALREYVMSFRALFKKGDPRSLDVWVGKYIESPFKMASAFAAGVKKDREAIANAITDPISNGPLEGVNNKLKAIKRSMYGHAGISLLLRKMMLSGCG